MTDIKNPLQTDVNDEALIKSMELMSLLSHLIFK